MLPNQTAPSFANPLALLRACHARMEERLVTLERLTAHLARVGADEEAREAAQRILNYFERAAPHHHADEEQDLFPALYAHAEGAALRAQLDALAAEHARLEEGWARLRPVLRAVAAGTAAALPDPAAWVTAYRAHIAREEQAVLPLAERILDAAALARLGAAMAARRGTAVSGQD